MTTTLAPAPFCFVTFSNVKDSQPTPQEKPWEEMVERLRVPRTGPKDGAAWSPVTYKPFAPRGNKGVETVNAAVFDLDHIDADEMAEIEQRIIASPYPYILHSTATHNPPEDCRFRLIIPLANPLPAEQWATARENLIRELKLPADPNAKDVARLFYTPTAPESGAEFLFDYRLEGQPANPFPPPTVSPAAEANPPTSSAAAPVDMFDLRSRLRKVRKTGSKEIIRHILSGAPLADEGKRDATLYRTMSVLAFTLPDVPDSAVLEIVRESVTSMPHNPGEDWMLLAATHLERAREDYLRVQQEDRELRDRLLAQACGESSAGAENGPSRHPYTIEEIERWATEQGTDLQGFEKRWIIQKGAAYYVFVDGRYQPPIMEIELDGSLERDLARSPVDLTRTNSKGDERPAKSKEIFKSNGLAARHLAASLDLQKSYYDPETQTFYEATSPVRSKLRPTEHRDVHEWLTLLGGATADILLDWVAAVTRLDAMCAALYLEGESGAGKNLLSTGLSRLWVTTGGPTEFASLVSGFNEAIARCPLVLVDEGFPKTRNFSINDELRRWVGSMERTLNRKFMPSTKLTGAIRLMICANNDRVLDGIEEMGEDDRQALAQRLLYVKVGRPPRLYIESMTPSQRADFAEQKIAEHALWLRDNREVRPGARFLVEGRTSAMHEKLAFSNGLTPAICEFMVRTIAAMTPQSAKTDAKLFQVGNGQIWVASKLFADNNKWERLVAAVDFPNSFTVNRTLMAMRKRRIRAKVDHCTRIDYSDLRVEMIHAFAQLVTIEDADLVLERINAPNPAMVAEGGK